MIKKSNHILLLIAILFALKVNGQTNRRNIKRPVAYKTNYQRMTTGPNANHSLEIRDGKLWAWGQNDQGQLGIGDTLTRLIASQIGVENDWVHIYTGAYHSAALKSNGTLWAWGGNSHGQLGIGDSSERLTPVQVGVDSTWISVALGKFHTIALKSDGTLWAWGLNNQGQLGDGSDSTRYIPERIGLDSSWTLLIAGENHSLGLKSNGTLWSWGQNTYGQLGTSDTLIRSQPTQVGSSNNWVNIACGVNHSFGIKSNGTLWDWGLNNYGQLGNGTFINQKSPLQIGSDNKWVNITGGIYHSLALKSNGTLWGWGRNNKGQLGDGSNINRSAPLQIGKDNIWVALSAGNEHNIGLQSDGTISTWGSNNNGQLGDSSTTNSNSPIKLTTNLYIWINVSGGYHHTVGLKSDGTIWSWGYNTYGQLGLGDTAYRYSPVQIGKDNKWVSVIAGSSHCIGLKSDGTLWGWGRNVYGELGDGSITNRDIPVQIGTDNDWISMTAAPAFTLAIKSDGTLWAWGFNPFGQLGDGTTTQRNSPVKIGSDDTWVSISADGPRTLGLKADGTIWGWGDNTYNEIGDSTNVNQKSPVKIGLHKDWIGVLAGQFHSFAIKSDGSLWAWGYNNNGQVGDSTLTNKPYPVLIESNQKWINIEAGYSHSMGLRADGSLWGWGLNGEGELGIGNKTAIRKPIKSGNEHNIVTIAAGWYHSIKLSADRQRFCSAGLNDYGQLGDSTNTSSTVFICNCYAPATPVSLGKKICSGTSATLTATGVGKIGWYDSLIGGNYLGGGNTYITPILNSSTTYYVQDSTCEQSKTRKAVLVSVTQIPTADAGTDRSICAGSITSIGSVAVAGNTYSWTSSPAGYSSNSANPNVAPTVNTIYYLTVSTSSSNCINQDSVLIQALPIPSALVGQNQAICEGSSLMVGDTSVSGNSYSWTSKPVGFTSNLSNPIVQPSLSTQYYLTETNMTTGCSKVDSVYISITSFTAAGAGTDKVICKNDSTFIGSVAINGNTYNWTSNPFGFSSSISKSMVKPIVTTQYYLAETNIASGCLIRDTVIVDVNQLPVITANASDTNICAGTKIILTGGGGNSYKWTTGQVDGAGFFPTSTSIYKVIGIDSNNCSDTASIQVTVNQPPNINTSISGTTITANQSGAAYQWLNCNNGYTPILNAINQDYTPIVNGDYAVAVTLNKCADTSACVNISQIGIENLPSNKNLFIIYPNPNNGSFTIQTSSNGIYKLVNEMGQMIKQFELNSSNQTVNLDYLNNGIYYIVGYIGNEIISKKIVVIK
ncbi:MAG: T9SS type A sorting domain-containing protein [Bacteroidetes bacterium]|nr:T9SS type A sorting domain-containing protein [Bacteroidota bacterium]